jgi:hypothetical protein
MLIKQVLGLLGTTIGLLLGPAEELCELRLVLLLGVLHIDGAGVGFLQRMMV